MLADPPADDRSLLRYDGVAERLQSLLVGGLSGVGAGWLV